jgi:isoaspartyl peptidase/L-asparaginase-like protein (Ntn-hydrolase superfamily)
MAEPIILSTWSFGRRANAAGFPILAGGGSALDAVEAACRDAEADPGNRTVGLGGLPDRSGRVSLDASIMLSPSQRGAVAMMRHHVHVISVARKVMETTPHVLLAGEEAAEFADEAGFVRQNLLTESARRAWAEEILKHPDAPAPAPVANIEESALTSPDAEAATYNLLHDTIGVLALDGRGVIAGGCTTSGMPFKLPGRVGDSPIIGHGLYVDPKHGAAVATGHGELVMGVCGAFLAVESMRNGASPQSAATIVIQRIVQSYQLRGDDQVGIITLKPDGNWACASIRPGFRTAIRSATRDELVDPGYVHYTGQP